MNATAIGLDVGRSATKVTYRDKSGKVRHEHFPSLAIPAFHISHEEAAAAAQRDTVTVEGRSYFIGDTALTQGAEHEMNLSPDWPESTEHRALLKAAMKRIEPHLADGQIMVVLGLPAEDYARMHKDLKLQAEKDLGFECKVIPQPMGPYYAHMLDEHGRPAAGRNPVRESWASMDVGRYTTDMIVMKHNQWIEKAAGSARGVNAAVEQFRQALVTSHPEIRTVDFTEAEEALREKRLRYFGKSVDVSSEVEEALGTMVREIRDATLRLIEPHARKLDGVILAGGGAQFVAEIFKEVWPHVVVADDPRFSVSEGMRRLASAMLTVREAANG